MTYKSARKDWEDSYTKGLDLLGFKYENPTQPFQGASGATHPVLAEAVTQFQAQAYKELLPATGPVHTQVIGSINRQKEDQSTTCKRITIELSAHGRDERVRTRVTIKMTFFNLPSLAALRFKESLLTIELLR
eukprot:TRINITY_DN9854_c0_g1_i1.p1 TRINITY_DN9854_c0_g1~~TRINITY_DN9854_c0_g1_i1.p1  ORF type:complete len:148 (+),score=13.44 TRINITY_DN9854_c0_g1_i1:48-446(+)